MTNPGSTLPVTGAWMPGDDPGHRKFFRFATDRRFALDCGAALCDVDIAYETWVSKPESWSRCWARQAAARRRR